MQPPPAIDINYQYLSSCGHIYKKGVVFNEADINQNPPSP